MDAAGAQPLMPPTLREKLPSSVNPFAMRPPGSLRTPLQLLQMVLVGLTLFPVRLGLIVLTAPAAAALAALVTVGSDPERPFGPIRRSLLQPIRWWARLCLWCFGYWWVETVRHPGSGGARVLVVAPHYSLLDVFYFAYAEMPTAISKKAVASIPLVGRIARAAQTIFVARRDPKSKHRAAAELRRRATEPGWPPLLVFPEGTCTNGRALIHFKAGAFAIGAPVQPITLEYGRDPLDVSAASADGYLRLLLAMLQPANRLRVTYLPVISPDEDLRADALAYAHAVRLAMSRALRVPVTEHSYDDVWFASAALDAHVDQTFTVKDVRTLLSLDLSGVHDLLRRFHALDASGDGELSYAEFVSALGLDDSPYARRLFTFFDVDDVGAVRFSSFVLGLALLSPNCATEDKLRLAFLICDLDGSGVVEPHELHQARPARAPIHARSPVKRASAVPPSPTQLVSYATGHVQPPPSQPKRVDCGGASARPPSPPPLVRTKSAIECAFGKFDTDGDRALNFDEFCAFMRANQARPRRSRPAIRDGRARRPSPHCHSMRAPSLIAGTAPPHRRTRA